MVNNKIFCVGFDKAGTTSLNSTFTEQMKIKAVHKAKWIYWSADPNESPILDHDAFSDGGTPLIEQLLKYYPDAYYILNTRPLQPWLTSRLKSLERNRAAVNWMLSELLPLSWIAKLLLKTYLSNSDNRIKRWIKIRNSYHKYVLELMEKSEKFLLLNIEDPQMTEQLQNFLKTKQVLKPVWTNQDGNGAEKRSVPKIIMDSFDAEINVTSSKEVLDAFFKNHQIEQHKDELGYFENVEFQLAKSFIDHLLAVIPCMKPSLKHLFLYLVTKRGQAKNFVSKITLDFLISLVRSEKCKDQFINVRYHV